MRDFFDIHALAAPSRRSEADVRALRLTAQLLPVTNAPYRFADQVLRVRATARAAQRNRLLRHQTGPASERILCAR